MRRLLIVDLFSLTLSLSLSLSPDYAPIQLSSSSNMRLTVNYELFVDLFQRSSLVFGTLDVVPATVKSRRSTTETPLYQYVEFQFRLLRNSTGTLLYSKTNSAIHNLQVRPSCASCTISIVHV